MNFHLTQVLTSHGCFASYLRRIGKNSSMACWFCGYHVDDAAHKLFDYDTFTGPRRQCSMEIGEEVTEDSMGRAILESKEKWTTVAKFASTVMHQKEREKRRRENELTNIHFS